jgi:hypothetical protein
MMIDAPVSGGIPRLPKGRRPHIEDARRVQVLPEQKPPRSRLWLEGHNPLSLWQNPTCRSWVLEASTAAFWSGFGREDL